MASFEGLRCGASSGCIRCGALDSAAHFPVVVDESVYVCCLYARVLACMYVRFGVFVSAGRCWTQQHDLNMKVERRLLVEEDERKRLRETRRGLVRTERLIQTFAKMRDLKP